jgi:hypothetical protein
MKNTKYTKELIACIASLALNAMCNTTDCCSATCAARRAQGGLLFYERFISHFFTYYAAMAMAASAAALSHMLCLGLSADN